jgi:MoxR-like ATPase
MTDLEPLIVALRDNIEKVLLGKPEAVRFVITSLAAGGHLLLEDVPGVGKTTLARALACSIAGEFRRIQFTPDLLPSDILGVSIYRAEKGDFEFKPGPVFCNILLADEINRTTPRTQSALLEAMNERQVTIDGVAHQLPRPFMVLATQNPYEFEGTYPLPESQLDRFLMRVRIGYPGRESEALMIRQQQRSHPLDTLTAVTDGAGIEALQRAACEIEIETSLMDYILDIVQATRESPHVDVGASPRATLALARASRALALVEGRNYVIPDDIKQLASPVLAHRIICRARYQDPDSLPAEAVLDEILEATAVPI